MIQANPRRAMITAFFFFLVLLIFWAIAGIYVALITIAFFFTYSSAMDIGKKAKRKYIDYLKENLQKCAAWAAIGQREDVLQFLAEHCVISANQMDIVISKANKYGQTAVLSSLMDQKRRKFGVKRKVFEL